MNEKQYLGDGVYVEINKFDQIILTTENGYEATNTIYLEWSVWDSLMKYIKAHLKKNLSETL